MTPWPTASRVVVVLGVPFLQAAGTNVPLLYVAAECLAMWVALVLMLADPRRLPALGA